MFDQTQRRQSAHDQDGGPGFGARAAYDQVPGGSERFGGFGRGPRGRGGRRGGPGFGAGFGGFGAGFGGGGWGGPRGRRGGPGRARRGDVRLAILALLAERPMHGYEMIQELGERTEGAWTPSPGSVYPTLTMLEEEGLIVGEEVDGKRRFSLTEAGTAANAAREGAPPWEQMLAAEDPNLMQLRDVLMSTMGAVQQVFRAGTPAQQAKATEILSETRRKLYEVLAAES